MDKRRKRRKKKNHAVPVVLSLIVIIAVFGLAVYVLEDKKPSTKSVDASSYFLDPAEGEMAVVTDRGVCEGKALLRDGGIYLPYETVKEFVADNVYYDPAAGILTVTKPEEICNAEAADGTFFTEADTVYISLSYLEKHTDIEAREFEDPARVVIRTEFDIPSAPVKAETEMRAEPGTKGDILCVLPEGTHVRVLDDGDAYVRCTTDDGFTGFVSGEMLGTREEAPAHISPQGAYTHNLMEEPVNMAFHQVYTYAANDGLNDMLSGIDRKVQIVCSSFGESKISAFIPLHWRS